MKHVYSLKYWARHVTRVSHVYHSITKTHFQFIFSKITIGTPGPPRHMCITCVSQYHQNTFLLYFFQKSPSGPRSRYVRLYHMCITYVSHVYHSITKIHFYSILSKNHQRDSMSATSHVYHMCITVSPKHTSTQFFSKNLHRNLDSATSHMYHIITKIHFYCIFFQNSPLESVTCHVRLYHMCIKISPKTHFYLIFFFQKSLSGTRARHVIHVSHVYHQNSFLLFFFL